jgi:hypothetical protein
VDLFNQIRKKLVIFVHFKGFNISQKPKSSPLSSFAQKTSLNLVPNWYSIIFTCPFRSDSCSYISVLWNVSEIATLILSMSLNFIWRNDKWHNKRVLIWHFTLVLIKINYGQIGNQTVLFYTTNPVFYTSGNRFVRRTSTFGNLWFFHLSRRTTVMQDLLVRRQFSLVSDKH